ncbi:MAG: hypothetical protein COB59_05450 [Rhodospirillaceae bacterium]|nr:MAG: hypothetical protein COB59_05450 [Rhodospirillaceae bacterium]
MAEILEAKERVDDLVFIAGHLIEILEKENLALQEHDYEVVRSLIEQKTKLSRAYEIRVLGMEKSEQKLNGIDAAVIDHLRQQSIKLQTLVETNAKMLDVNIKTGKLYMNVLADSVKSSSRNADTYSSRGFSSDDSMNGKNNGASFAIDENL